MPTLTGASNSSRSRSGRTSIPTKKCAGSPTSHFPKWTPATYGKDPLPRALPTIDTFWLGGADIVSPEITGTVLLSAGDLSGCEWPSSSMNPYRDFEHLEPSETIDAHGVLVYRGTFSVRQAAALQPLPARHPVNKIAGKPEQALPLAREAVAIDPEEIISQTALGDSAAALGQNDEARQAWQSAIASARRLEPEAQPSYITDLEAKLRKL